MASIVRPADRRFASEATHDDMTIERRAAGVLALIAPIAAAAAAIALIAFSLRSYEVLKRYLDTFASDGDAEAFTRGLFASLVVSSRLAAVALIGVAGVLSFARKGVERAVASILSSTIGDAASAIGEDIQTLRAETAWHLAALVSIVTLGVVLRVRALGQPINYDEAFTYIQYASRPFFVGWSDYSYPNNHLLHTLLVHVSTRLFGTALWAVRIPAVVAGCAAIPLSYAVARRLTGRREGLIVAALTAVSQAMITFSVVARGYSILVAFFLLAISCAFAIVVTRSRVLWTLFTCVTAAGFVTVPVFLYPYGGMMLWLLWAGLRDRRNRALRPGAIILSAAWTVALTAACYAPAAATTGLQSGLDYALPIAPSGFGASLSALTNAAADVFRGLPVALVVALVASAALAITQRWRTAVGILPVAIVIVPAVLVPIQGKLAPARAWIYLLPVLFVYAAAGVVSAAEWIASFAARTAAPALAGALAAAFALAVTAHALTHRPTRYAEWPSRSGVYGDTDLDEVANYLRASLTPQDALVVASGDEYPLEYYLRLHDVPLAPFKNPPRHPKRLVVLANETKHYPVARVLASRAVNFQDAMQPRLLRTFAYSSVYEIELPEP